MFLLRVVVPLARDLAEGLALRLNLSVGGPGEDEDEPPAPSAHRLDDAAAGIRIDQEDSRGWEDAPGDAESLPERDQAI